MAEEKAIKQILEALGGHENIKNYEHCATRMRIVVKDEDKVDKDKADEVDESKGYFFNTGQHKFIFGTGKVNSVHKAFDKHMQSLTGGTTTSNSVKEDAYKNLSPVQRLVRVFADILVPLIPALVTTGLLWGSVAYL